MLRAQRTMLLMVCAPRQARQQTLIAHAYARGNFPTVPAKLVQPDAIRHPRIA